MPVAFPAQKMETETTTTPPTNVTRNSLLSALAQASVMVAGGINAVVIGARYPVSSSTDSLFTAFAIYSLWLVIASSMRTALVSRLLDRDDTFGRFNVAIGSLAWAVLPIAVVQLGVGIPLVSAAADGQGSLGSEALLVFLPAAVLQLAIAITASMFAVLDEFTVPTRAFALGGIVNVIAFLVFEPLIGLLAMPLAAVLSSSATSLVLVIALHRHGWRGSALLVPKLRQAREWLSLMVLGSAYAIGTQALYLISMLIAASSLPPGSATVYTYAYMAVGLVIALSASSGAMALAAPVAANWSGTPADLDPVEDDVTRSMSVVLVGVAGTIAIFGASLIGPLLPGFTAADIDELVRAATILCLLAIGSGITIVPLVALFTLRSYGRVAVVTMASIPFLALLTLLLLQLEESLASIALAASISVVLLAWGLLWLLHGADTPARIAAQLWQISLVAIPGAAIYFACDWVLIGADAGFALHLAAATLGGVVFALYVALALPSYRDLLLRMVRQAIGRGAPA